MEKDVKKKTTKNETIENKSKKSIFIGLTVLLLVALVLIGLTYAYYRTRIVENTADKSISVTSKKLEVVYSDDDPLFTATGVRPGYNNEDEPKEFTITNTGDETVEYAIKLDNVENGFNKGVTGDAKREAYNDWTYELINKDTASSVASGDITLDAEQVIVGSVSIDSKEIQNYQLIIRYKELDDIDQSDDMGQTLSFRINIGDKQTDAGLGIVFSLHNAILNNNTLGTPSTIAGQVASASAEAVFASAEGLDGKDTYYFRGNVQNNYVTYSNMCWRIVRIMENGDIKIILADRDNPCGTANEYNVNDSQSAFVADPASYTFEYGTQDDFKNKTVYSILKAWAGISADRTFTAHFMSPVESGEFTNEVLDLSKLSTTPNWCIDNSIYSNDGTIYYGAYGRLENYSSAAPSLNCEVETVNDIQVGLLSADEAAFAGSTSNSSITYSHYLKTNATANWYSTLSPAYCYYDDCNNFVMNSNADLGTDALGEGSGTIRPVVVLRSDVTLATTDYIQDGTIDKPYVIS